MNWPYNLALFALFYVLAYYAGWRASKHWHEHKRARQMRRIQARLHRSFRQYSSTRDERAALWN